MTYAAGCDVSRYNASFDPDRASGVIDFAIQKATEGLSYIDTSLDLIWQGVAKVGIRGAYHYQRSGVSWLAQADHFLETALRHDYHIAALDLEEYNNTYGDTFFSDTKRIIDYWRLNSTRQVILYTNGSSYDQMYYSLMRVYGSSVAGWLEALPLWIASPYVTAGSPVLPKTRKTWQIHQYSWKGFPSRWGTGGTQVDENVYNGDVSAMRLWAGGQIVTPPPPGETMQSAVIKGTTSLKVRQGPATVYQQVDGLNVGDTAFGQLDTASNWFHLSSIKRASGVTVNRDGWASAAYLTITDIVPPVVTDVLPDVLYIATKDDMSDKKKYTKVA